MDRQVCLASKVMGQADDAQEAARRRRAVLPCCLPAVAGLRPRVLPQSAKPVSTSAVRHTVSIESRVVVAECSVITTRTFPLMR